MRTVPDTITAGGTPFAPAATMDEIEARMGLEPLDVLQEQRGLLVDELAELRAFDKSFDGLRKAYRSVRVIQLRDKYLESNAKVPGWDLLEAEASADEDYRNWLDEATTKLARKEVLEFRVLEISETIQRSQMVGRFVTAERFS